MTEQLWAPWRLESIRQAHEIETCVFCAEAAGEVPADQSLLVHRVEHAIVLLNKFTY